MLRVENLYAGYTRDNPIVRGVTFTAPPGQVTLVIGPNGAGKSTLLKAIYGLVRILDGRVMLEKLDVTGWKPSRLLRAGLALSPQSPAIFPEMSVEENLKLAAWLAGLDEDTVEEALEYIPVLKAKRRIPASLLSGGEKRLLDVARVILYKPKVLLFDEPTAGVAPKVASQIYEIIRRLADEGRTVLLVDQRVREAIRIADTVIVMAEGRIEAMGPREEIEAKLREIAASWLTA
ncbi:ABC transporter-related protein [Pyrolobus fumarii 1A]|uniref:ABC transporter-related protein n=1 Tax=Pyrolobus fumarii (strain DSM 11204 / 1A) TaxID=694429 RepID=G0ECV5_PYRF1|nr:ABC transporter ATP-binding protein [Pyrolobus fumarii]AEM39675.1 ABC transporter-related protein [Pyrolobus fumarii 1A]